MPAKPSLVFVPGAWHDSSCWTPTTSILSSKHQYQVSLVALPSAGSELRGDLPVQNWDADVSAIRSTIVGHLDKSEDVILVAHSYGGCPASEAAKGLGKKDRGDKSGIVRLVWISAMALPIGACVWEKTGGKPAYPDRVVIKGDLSYTREEDDWFYNQCTPTQLEEARKHLCSLAWKVFTGSSVTYQAWKDIPATYLLCENDHSILPAGQEAMIKADEECWRVERCDGDHSPFISRVDFTVGAIRRAAGEDV